MKITKNSPASTGHLACLVNATIEVLNLNIPKIEGRLSISTLNKKLNLLGKDYKSTTKLNDQWKQFFDILEQLISEDNQKNDIEELAEKYYDRLNREGHL